VPGLLCLLGSLHRWGHLFAYFGIVSRRTLKGTIGLSARTLGFP
jgi:hypothetical protein